MVRDSENWAVFSPFCPSDVLRYRSFRESDSKPVGRGRVLWRAGPRWRLGVHHRDYNVSGCQPFQNSTSLICLADVARLCRFSEWRVIPF